MTVQRLNITNDHNQRFTTSVEVDGKQIDLEIFLRYNTMAGYWVADVKDLSIDTVVISSMPLLAGQNLLGQYGYLAIGSCGILNFSGLNPDDLDDQNFTKDFFWDWDDTETV